MTYNSNRAITAGFYKSLVILILLVVSCADSNSFELDQPDYLPLKVGNWWEYTFYELNENRLDVVCRVASGQAVIEVLSFEDIGSSRHYDIQLIKSGTVIDERLVNVGLPDPQVVVDTTAIDLTTTLVFVQNSQNIVTSIGNADFFDFMAPRYRESDESSVRIFQDELRQCCYYLELEKDVGIFNYVNNESSNSSAFSYRWTLQASNLDN